MKMFRLNKGRIYLCFIALVLIVPATLAFTQSQKKTIKQDSKEKVSPPTIFIPDNRAKNDVLFSHEYYSLIKKCFEKRDLTEWNQRRRKLPQPRIYLGGAYLGDAYLQNAYLTNVDFTMTEFWGANLQGADFSRSNLHNAFMARANLTDANLTKTNLTAAEFYESNLTNADLSDANLTNVCLYETILTNSNFDGANLTNTQFEPNHNSLPDILSIAKAKYLSKLRYENSPCALLKLRNGFKEAGLRKHEREVTYAIKHSTLKNKISGDSLLKKIEAFLEWVFFELTCKWGMTPERPLLILASLIIVFTIPYTLAMTDSIFDNKKINGIWKVWIRERMRRDLGAEEPELLSRKWNSAIINGMYFSILSAFNIGWRDLNVGNWIARIQPYEYRLQASGWPRTISGIQSLISVYLLVLSFLTYFGRPFESY